MFPLKNLARKGLIMHTYVALLVTLVAGLHARLTNCFFFKQSSPKPLLHKSASVLLLVNRIFPTKMKIFRIKYKNPILIAAALAHGELLGLTCIKFSLKSINFKVPCHLAPLT